MRKCAIIYRELGDEQVDWGHDRENQGMKILMRNREQ